MSEILPIKPQSDAVAPAIETEEAPGTAEPLVQIARRLLHGKHPAGAAGGIGLTF